MTLKHSEPLWIGGTNIRVVPGGGASTVRLGIEAPDDVVVLREEVWVRDHNRERED